MDIQIKKTAEELTLKFADDSDIPTRFKKNSSNKPTKTNLDTKIEFRFRDHVDAWTLLINSILKQIKDKDQAWRFIRVRPLIESSAKSLIDCKDFLDFTDYLIRRRDKENCDDDELGRLCMLQTAFQKEVERKLIK